MAMPFSYTVLYPGMDDPMAVQPVFLHIDDVAAVLNFFTIPSMMKIAGLSYIPANPNIFPEDSKMFGCNLCFNPWTKEFHWPMKLKCGHVFGEMCIMHRIYVAFKDAGTNGDANCCCPICDKEIFPFHHYAQMRAQMFFCDDLFCAEAQGPAMDVFYSFWNEDPNAAVNVDALIFHRVAPLENHFLEWIANLPSASSGVRAILRLPDFDFDWAISGMLQFVRSVDGRVIGLTAFFEEMQDAVYRWIYNMRQPHSDERPGAGTTLRRDFLPPHGQDPHLTKYIDNLIKRTIVRARIMQAIAI